MKNKKGFTLVELIAIIIIIGIIIGIIAPTAIKLIEKSKVNSFREGLRSIIRSAEIYMEENDLKTLPDEGIYLQDNDLDIDYADGYNGIIKYINGEVVIQNVGNGTYCGNGSKDTLSVTDYSADCVVVKPETQCFIMGTTDTAGDTIVGYDLNNAKCDPTNLVIPATVNDVPVKYIGDGAFLESYDYVFGSGYYDTTPLGKPDLIQTTELLVNLSYMGITPIAKMYFSNLPSISKFCLTSSMVKANVQVDYEMSSTNEYIFCAMNFFSDSTSYMAKGIGITSVDFSNAINLVEIGDSAFIYNYLTGSLDLSGATNLTEIAANSFSYNQIESLTLPSSLVKIGVSAFEGNQLQTITIPSSVTTIGDYAFGDNNWSSVTIEANSTNKEDRFNDNWEDIGWSYEFMPEEIGSEYEYTLLTSGENNFDYVKGSYIIAVPLTGSYKVQLWGAAGGGADPGTGGYGGYISANFTLTAGVTYKLVIGQGGRYADGFEGSILASQGGGGAGYGYGGSGGGATIISINQSTTIIGIAGGGGGASDECYPDNGTVGSGGYLYSSLGNLNGTNSTYRSGGSQSEGGQDLGNASYGNNGSYLQGGAGIGNDDTCLNINFDDCNSGGGGGGGYYGGSGGGADTDAGSGGSSYVNTTYGTLNAEEVPIAIPLRHSYGEDSDAESGYAKITYIG